MQRFQIISTNNQKFTRLGKLYALIWTVVFQKKEEKLKATANESIYLN